jgi:hypothetical protein
MLQHGTHQTGVPLLATLRLERDGTLPAAGGIIAPAMRPASHRTPTAEIGAVHTQLAATVAEGQRPCV